MADHYANAVSALKAYPEHFKAIAPGFFVSVIVAITAQFLSEHYGAPAMLMALLLGIAFHFLAEEGRCVTGIEVSAKGVLRIGIALLGARISVDLLIGLGAELILLIIFGVIATIFFGWLVGRFFGADWRFSILTGGAVAICGASAAMAIAAVLPRNERSESNLIFTVLSVTVLSTIAMILYPVITQSLGLDTTQTGVFLGGTIHDVAQVVGAGFSISQETGETATLVKLIRVTMLAPVVLVLSLAVRARGEARLDEAGKRPPLLPGFVIVFLILAGLNSLGMVPAVLAGFLNELSRWALLIAIAAVGMKTSLREIFNVGGSAIALIVVETIFLAVLILLGLGFFG